MLFEAVYSDYRDFGGVKFPCDRATAGRISIDLAVADVKPNAAVIIQPPQGRGGGAGGGGRPPRCRPRRPQSVFLIPGIWPPPSTSATHRGEKGRRARRPDQIIAEAKRLIPGKPIRYVVHHHIDHRAGCAHSSPRSHGGHARDQQDVLNGCLRCRTPPDRLER
jgi:hypothetical protein